MLGKLLKFVVTRLVPCLVMCLALFLGYLHTQPMPEGTFFTLLVPLAKGKLPPRWTGGYKDCPVPPLPTSSDNKVGDPRPANERLITLPGYVPRQIQVEQEGGIIAQEDPDHLASFQIPQQGLGMCCRVTAYDPESVRRTIQWYLKVGGRHIDTADLYLNHEWIGQGMRQAMTDYAIPRSEIFVTTKLYPRMFGRNATIAAVKRMVQELKLDYVDMVLMHSPSNPMPWIGAKTECNVKGYTPKECRVETWKALSELRNQGLVRHVGVSNFVVHQMQELQTLRGEDDAIAPIASNQFQFNPWASDKIYEAFDYCQDQGITVTAYSSFAGSMMQHMMAFSVDTLQSIATRHSTTVPQILLAWAMQKGAIVIPGTGNPEHMKENLKAYDMQLSDREMKDITALRSDETAKEFLQFPLDES